MPERIIKLGQIFRPTDIGQPSRPIVERIMPGLSFGDFVLRDERRLLDGLIFVLTLKDSLEVNYTGNFTRFLCIDADTFHLERERLVQREMVPNLLKWVVPFGFKLEGRKRFTPEALEELQRLRLHHMRPHGRVEVLPDESKLDNGELGFGLKVTKIPTDLMQVKVRLIRAD